MAFELVFREWSPEQAELCGRFTCGRDSLNEFLRDDASNFQKYGLSNTTLVFVQGDAEIAGYFSLSSASLRLTTMEAGELGLPFEAEIKFFPAVKITKLAVATKYHRRGMGEQLVEAIEGLVYGKAIATRILTVDAINEPEVLSFYKKAGFVDSMEAERQAQRQRRETIAMWKDIYAEA